MTARKWDLFAAELVDTRANQRRQHHTEPCVYCSKPTRAVSRICCDHDDLPALEVEATLDQLVQESERVE